VVVTWIVIKFLNGRLTKVPFQFLSITQVPFVIRIEIEGAKNKIVRPKQAERYLTKKKKKFMYDWAKSA
jgi:hypothetical protein